ncbi:hypothetical protein CYMTET_19406 [Cymbomonas tetramitiformis]|uniref:Uncharacterized protein n=1 Tax=Cymbomonas tetramitiformis TaxID=36881 RepID=A0AAE0G7G7_9CHLO|nr:hypothetical protein CYMTET_19406 [Cymbomonas tetramitiformis]
MGYAFLRLARRAGGEQSSECRLGGGAMAPAARGSEITARQAQQSVDNYSLATATQGTGAGRERNCQPRTFGSRSGRSALAQAMPRSYSGGCKHAMRGPRLPEAHHSAL